MIKYEEKTMEWVGGEVPGVFLFNINGVARAMIVKESPIVFTGYVFNGYHWLRLDAHFDDLEYAQERIERVFK